MTAKRKQMQTLLGRQLQMQMQKRSPSLSLPTRWSPSASRRNDQERQSPGLPESSNQVPHYSRWFAQTLYVSQKPSTNLGSKHPHRTLRWKRASLQLPQPVLAAESSPMHHTRTLRTDKGQEGGSRTPWESQSVQKKPGSAAEPVQPQTYYKKFFRVSPRAHVGLWLRRGEEDTLGCPEVLRSLKAPLGVRRRNHPAIRGKAPSVASSWAGDSSEAESEISRKSWVRQPVESLCHITIHNCADLVHERIAEMRAEIARRGEERAEDVLYLQQVRKEQPHIDYLRYTMGDKINMIEKLSDIERRRLAHMSNTTGLRLLSPMSAFKVKARIRTKIKANV